MNWSGLPKHKFRDAARLGLQSAVAAAAVFAILDYWSMPEKFVGVLSAVLVIETSIGASLGQSWKRFAATLAGCGIGLICLLLVPSGVGTIVALAVSMFVMNGVAVFQPSWRYGVVAAVALSIGTEGDLVTTAIERCSAIGIGVVIGSISSVIVWPEKSSSRAWREVRIALKWMARYLDQAVTQTIHDDDTDFDKFANRYSTHISSARSLANEVRIENNETLFEAIKAVERLYHSIIIIERVARRNNNVHQGDAEFQDSIDAAREVYQDTATGLSRSTIADDDQFDRVDAKITELQQRLANETYKDVSGIERAAFVFAMIETRDCLKQLNSLFSERA